MRQLDGVAASRRLSGTSIKRFKPFKSFKTFKPFKR
jgi:hypothetical protein